MILTCETASAAFERVHFGQRSSSRAPHASQFDASILFDSVQHGQATNGTPPSTRDCCRVAGDGVDVDTDRRGSPQAAQAATDEALSRVHARHSHCAGTAGGAVGGGGSCALKVLPHRPQRTFCSKAPPTRRASRRLEQMGQRTWKAAIREKSLSLGFWCEYHESGPQEQPHK